MWDCTRLKSNREKEEEGNVGLFRIRESHSFTACPVILDGMFVKQILIAQLCLSQDIHYRYRVLKKAKWLRRLPIITSFS